ncbi:XopAW family type III secretion system calcium-binding effector [Variovorax sp. LT2P21]|uniref:XopAW family type III secretion system calcium-binding effector n=1 Tax=Variovorax sp. LT2P21 TaxID=3443731 RepID=UPI003F451571
MSAISGVSSASNSWFDMRSQMQAKMLAKADTDKSGGVDKTELQGVLDNIAEKTGVAATGDTAELFGKMDADGDGSVSGEELAEGMKDLMPKPGGDKGDDLFAKADADGDSLVSKVEMQILLAKMTGEGAEGTSSTEDTVASDELFAKLDSDGDGSLSQTEFEAGRPSGPEGAPPAGGPPPAGGAGGGGGGGGVAGVTTYDPLDTNEDGEVSLAERMAGNVSTDAVQALLEAVDTDGDSEVSSAESDAFVQALSAQVDSTDVSTQGTLGGNKLVELVQRAYAQMASESEGQTRGSTLDTSA